jgi:uncharacterized membrane-anchored protein
MHPQRQFLHNELHARPSLYFDGPAHVFHLAFFGGENECKALLHSLAPLAVDTDAAQGITDLNGHPLKWERHAEFFTLTQVITSGTNELFWVKLPDELESLIRPHLSILINSVQIIVRSDESWEGSVFDYGFKDPSGSCIGGSDAFVWSDFRLCPEGTNRFLFINKGLNAYRQGRMIRRLLEIETYRMMASLALPTAKELDAQLSLFERRLVHLSDLNTSIDKTSAKTLLADIASLSAQVVSLKAKTRHRLSATQAYAQLVFERLGELRESHVGGCQRLGVFIERRFKPTVRYCAVTEQRLDQLATSVVNLGDLLQARVQVEMEEQNSEILKSLNSRADAQVKIQRAVEGLSIIAITYYLLSLLKLSYSALQVLGIEISERKAMLAMAPIAFGILLLIVSRIKKAKEH